MKEQLVKSSGEGEQNEEEADEEETDETLAERIEEARSVLEKLEESRRENKDCKRSSFFFFISSKMTYFSARLDDELLTQIYKLKLMSPPCQNQGYILDGYPKTLEQAQNLFGGNNNN